MMWKTVKLILLFVFATVCHWGFATLFSFWGLNVNFMLVFAAAFCAFSSLEIGYPVAFLCGLFLDFFGAKLFGNNAFSFTAAALVVYAARERINFDSVVSQVFGIFVLTCGVSLLNLLLLDWFVSAVPWPGVWSLLGSAAVGALLAPFVFWIVGRCWAPPVEEYD